MIDKLHIKVDLGRNLAKVFSRVTRFAVHLEERRIEADQRLGAATVELLQKFFDMLHLQAEWSHNEAKLRHAEKLAEQAKAGSSSEGPAAPPATES